jgi:hypothetical protein
LADRRRQGNIGLQRALRLHDGPQPTGDHVRIAGNGAIARRQHRHCIVEGEGRSDSAPDIEHDLADSSPHRILGTHRIRPEPVQLALLERARCRDAERHARLVRRWNAYDPHPVPLEIDTGFDEHPLEHQVDERSCSDGPTLDCVDVSRLRRDVGVHHQEPMHALRQRGEQLGAPPLRERRQGRVARRASRPPNDSRASGLGTVIFDSTEIAASYSFRIEGVDYGPVTGLPPQTPANTQERFCEPVSVSYRTGLRHANGNWKMATRDLRPKTVDPGHETGNIGARDSRPSPVCGTQNGNWKMATRDLRPKTADPGHETGEYWRQRLEAFSLNPGKAGGSPTPGKHDAETGLAG